MSRSMNARASSPPPPAHERAHEQAHEIFHLVKDLNQMESLIRFFMRPLMVSGVPVRWSGDALKLGFRPQATWKPVFHLRRSQRKLHTVHLDC